MNFKHFNLTNGHLQVNDPGVYYIYAQVGVIFIGQSEVFKVVSENTSEMKEAVENFDFK